MGRENILLEAESFTTVDESNVSETTKEKSNTENGVYVKGMALPFGETSRNGVQYEKQSVKDAHEDLQGRTMLFNHKQDWVTGHILNTEITENGMYFEGDINPNAEMPNGVPVAEAIERGDINSVSIQAFIEQLGEEADEDAVIGEMETEKVAVKDFLEISAVSIPGFPSAEALPEHLEHQGVQPITEAVGGKSLEEQRQDEKASTEENNEENQEEEQEEEISKEQFEFNPVPTHVLYDNREDAMQRAENLGLENVHEHEMSGQVYYMAGDNHEEWLEALDRENPLDREDTNTEETFDDYPDAAVENARMALEAKEDTGNPNDCGTQVGWERANQLDNKENLSEDTIGRMAAFSRHEDNKDQGDEGRADCGWLMWNAWGGDEGIAWAKSKMDELDEENLSDETKEMLEESGIMTNEEESGQEEGSAESEKAKSEMNPNEMMDSVMDTIDGHNEELKSELRDLMEALMDEDKSYGDKDDEDDEEEEESESSGQDEDSGLSESVEELEREKLESKFKNQEEKINSLEERLEKIVDEDEGTSRQESPSSENESSVKRRPGFKDLL